MEWFGEFGADRWAYEAVGPSGYFVDVGAGDGVTRSNTLALEQLGWAGVCVEASSDIHPLRENRKAATVGAYVGERRGSMPWHENQDRTLSGNPELMLDRFKPKDTLRCSKVRPTVSLDEVLDSVDAPARIDFLSLDTEGSEAIILSSHDWTRYTFDLIAVEHNGQTRKRTAILAQLSRLGMTRVHSIGVDDFYMANRR